MIGFVCYVKYRLMFRFACFFSVHIRKLLKHSILYFLVVQYFLYLAFYFLQFFLTKIQFLFQVMLNIYSLRVRARNNRV